MKTILKTGTWRNMKLKKENLKTKSYYYIVGKAGKQKQYWKILT